ncbi:uncharacterized protein LOC111614332 [Centruroides sculpturatus]|uniref:uncharacterized protein LOC111614332 n=1 Tax=Centruroides sculpturatus TaxID=218467 RepID=UPI000C6C9DFA|nr:uncharacterized protein LOC111614332 [Centruroides sculpturatus]
MIVKFLIYLLYPASILAFLDIRVSRTEDQVKIEPVANYTLKDCSEKGDVLFLEHLKIEPIPLKLQEKFTLRLTLTLNEDIPSPIQVHIEAEALVSRLFSTPHKMKFPCELFLKPLNLSCPITDLCETIFIKDKNCANVETNEVYPCSCPLKKGMTMFSEFKINPGEIPPPILRYLRAFRPNANIKLIAKRLNRRLGCISADVSIFTL